MSVCFFKDIDIVLFNYCIFYFFIFGSWANLWGRVILTSCAALCMFMFIIWNMECSIGRDAFGKVCLFLESVVPSFFCLGINFVDIHARLFWPLTFALGLEKPERGCGQEGQSQYSIRCRSRHNGFGEMIDDVRSCGIVDEQNHPRNKEWHFRISMKMSLLYHLPSSTLRHQWYM